MRYRVAFQGRAERDVRQIVDWIEERSPAGASSWLDALEQLTERLSSSAESFGAAQESGSFDEPLRQALFRTRRGRTYRVVFTIVGDEVRVLRIRGPGQAPVRPGDT